MTRWSEVKEVLSDSSIRDVPQIVNEDFVNNAIVNDENVNKEIVYSEIVHNEIVRSLVVNGGFLGGEEILGNESIQGTPEEQDAIDDEVTGVITITSIIITSLPS